MLDTYKCVHFPLFGNKHRLTNELLLSAQVRLAANLYTKLTVCSILPISCPQQTEIAHNIKKSVCLAANAF